MVRATGLACLKSTSLPAPIGTYAVYTVMVVTSSTYWAILAPALRIEFSNSVAMSGLLAMVRIFVEFSQHLMDKFPGCWEGE